MKPTYYVVVNDLIGGYDVSQYDMPTSEHTAEQNEYVVAWGVTEEKATLIADALNHTCQ